MRRHLFILLVPFLFPVIVHAQVVPSDEAVALFEPPTYDSVEMANEISYPEHELRMGEEKRFFIVLLIDSNGSRVTPRHQASSLSFAGAVDAAVTGHNGFRPGRLNGVSINTRLVLAFAFTVDEKGQGSISTWIDTTTYGEDVDQSILELRDPAFVPQSIAPTYDQAELLSHITYPPKARDLGIEGTVYVVAKLDEKGRVVDATVIKGVDPELDRTAVEAVKKTTFTPAIHRGEPVKFKITLPIMFRLTNDTDAE